MNFLEEDSDSDLKFTINKDYADRYDKWRQGEELQKLKDKYGADPTADSSSSEDEDDNARELTHDIEKDFFKTLSFLKQKDPKIYDQNVHFFTSQKPMLPEETKMKKKVSKNDRFYSLGEYQRRILFEKGGQFSDEEDNKLSNVEEEKALKKSFVNALSGFESETEEEGWGNLFKKKIKTSEELRAEEEDYKLWLAGEKKKLKNSDEEQELKGLHDFWCDPALDENEQFLRDYILNKRFLEKDCNQKNFPDRDSDANSESELSADENTLKQQEEFERKYNFRFEEPDGEFIKRYPRTLEHSMRKTDDKRKRHRKEVKARKEAEKARKVEELKRLKTLKRKEIMEKIKKLQEITGNEDMGFQTVDLESDFNPEDHDKRMSELFNEEYYGACEEEEKPECPDLEEELEIENWDDWGEKEEELHCEDPGFNMDCDYEPDIQNEVKNEFVELSKKRKKRRQSKFSAAVAKKKPLFDPKDKSFEKYVDEYYSLDYEDLIGDLPCRFKYRKVVPNDFGLSVEEILSAPDKELNSWVSVKKIMQRRPEHVELYDVKAYKKKAKDFNKKRKCLPSIYVFENNESDIKIEREAETEKSDSKNISGEKSQRKKGGFRKRTFSFDGKQNDSKSTRRLVGSSETNNGISNNFRKSKNHKKFKSKFDESHISETKKGDSQATVHGIPDARLKSYGINPKKLKNKLKWKPTN